MSTTVFTDTSALHDKLSLILVEIENSIVVRKTMEEDIKEVIRKDRLELKQRHPLTYFMRTDPSHNYETTQMRLFLTICHLEEEKQEVSQLICAIDHGAASITLDESAMAILVKYSKGN